MDIRLAYSDRADEAENLAEVAFELRRGLLA